MRPETKVLLITPPMSDLHTPYPATTYLAAHLQGRAVDVRQADWSLELFLRLFSRPGLERLRDRVEQVADRPVPAAMFFLAEFDRYCATIDPVVRFLQGRDLGLSTRIVGGRFLPDSPELWRQRRGWRFDAAAEYGRSGEFDLARRLCQLLIGDIARVVASVEPGFGLKAYAEETAKRSTVSELTAFLDDQADGLVAGVIADLVDDEMQRSRPDVVGVTIPFPGNLVGALRVAQIIRSKQPEVKIVFGGGYVNCGLRELSDVRLFDYVDYVTLDDGERPLSCILEHVAGERPSSELLRTFVEEDGGVAYHSSPREQDVPFVETRTPTHAGLPLDRYPTIQAGVTNRRCNKLTLAHGCYWRKCAFCDIKLDYVQRYEPQRAGRLVEHIEAMIDETGCTTFHWVDEAAPPSLLRALARRLIDRGITISWYGNIRFERAFTSELVDLLAESGCVMVMGGLEVASDRILQLMEKGVTVGQVARVARRFAAFGVHVHAYLMHGFPSQTVQETVDSLERVRQLFAADCLHSGYWHQFFATPHSPIGVSPDRYGISIPNIEQRPYLEHYNMPFVDSTGVDHRRLQAGLDTATAEYVRGDGLDRPVQEWFEDSVPSTSVPADLIASALLSSD